MDTFNNSSSPNIVDNPSDCERRAMLEYILKMQNRLEDFNNIIELMSPADDIVNVCKPGLGKRVKVAIIGAGEAGLAAALELKKIGCNITLFEASSRIGGRVFTYYFDRVNKYYGEFGPMSIPISHETTWHYINLLKINTTPFVCDNENSLFYLRNERAVRDNKGKSVIKNIYPNFHLKNSERKRTWFELQNKIYDKYFKPLNTIERKELVQIKSKYAKKIEEIDKLSYRAAYENLDLSADAIAMLGYLEGKEQFFKLSLTEILQGYYTADEEYTYRIDEGMIKLPYLLYEALCDNVEDVYKNIEKDKLGYVKIKTSTPITGIYNKTDSNYITLKYKDSLNNKESLEEFDYVVCAIPFSSLRRVDINPLFTVSKMQAINEMNYEVAQKIYIFLKERFWEMGSQSKRIIGGRSFTDLPLTSIYYPSDHAKALENRYGNWEFKGNVKPKDPGVLLASYNWCQDAIRLGSEIPELQINDVIRYIEKIHTLPEHYIDDKIIDYRSLIWSDVQYIWAAGALSKPEDKNIFSYTVTMPEMSNKVFFAGEHISQKHVTQQGALQSGMIAANEVAKQISIKNR